MGCSLSTKICLLCIFTILFFGVILYKRMDFLGVLGFYVAMTPCICCWIASKDEKSDEPHFPYNRPLRSIYPAPDPSFKEKMAERALELENFLEGSPKASIEDPPIPKGSIANSLSQKKFKLKDGCELSLELTLNVETTVTQIQKHEEKCSNEGKGTVRKESDVGEEGFKESSKREDEEHQKFSLYKREDVELQEYSLDKREDEEHQEFSLGKREDVELQEFSLDKKDDEELQGYSLDKVPLEFLYTQGH